MFDTSDGRGPAPMIAGQVIPGFAEALNKMQKGGRYEIRIPADARLMAPTPPPGSRSRPTPTWSSTSTSSRSCPTRR